MFERARPTKGLSATAKLDLLLIVACGAAMRVLYHLTYRPWWCGDSGGYSTPYWQWIHHQVSDGARTPIYPLFLGLSQLLSRTPAQPIISAPSAHIATILQSVLGIIAGCLVYDTLRRLGVRRRVSLSFTLLSVLLAGVCQFEMLILTEPLSLFANVIAVWLFVRSLNAALEARDVTRPAIATGIAFGIAVLVRPESLAFAVVLVFTSAVLSIRIGSMAADKALAQALRRTAILIPVAAIPIVFAWMTSTYVGIGQFRLTTLSGIDKSASVYNLFDRVGPKDKVAGEIIHRSYLARNQGGPPVRDHIFGAIPELIARHAELPTRVDPRRVSVDVADYVGRVSLRLARRNPRAWLANIMDNFVHDTFDFRYSQTSPANTTDPRAVQGGSVVRYVSLWRFAVWANGFEAPLLIILYVVTIGIALLSPWLILRARTDNDVRAAVVAAFATGILAVFIGACVLAYYGNQYGEPFLPVMAICAAYALERLMQRLTGNIPAIAAADLQQLPVADRVHR